ncbi:glycoside hydrolase family 68 protein [Sporolactobacillus sp. STSJ-5]|uniref:glycoside hydrolase family 68 protein n=1 Tax=Sporolactobacillus sp. STSJ-5 TaxID=2965076 RepID=UPI002107129E|nr:glycoside hydrolase family 68 protein [Sporolactobacillus sp. STSJ-5]MCQ2011132.1 glycoside hydrolase family 68 protein [Sporolactobacillus sp. STSJ-5]
MFYDQPNIPADWQVTSWTREDASSMGYNSSNTFPVFDISKVKSLDPERDIWDNWLVVDEEGKTADVNGYNILIALGAPVGDLSQARLMYFYSKQDENSWAPGGYVFADRLIEDTQEWSGSTIFTEDGYLQFFYTIASSYQDPETGIYQTNQRFATAKVPVAADSDKLQLLDPTYHELLIEPDGYLYQSVEQASRQEQRFPVQHRADLGSDQVNNFTFRDPHYFKDPADGTEYLLFEANTGEALNAEGTVRDQFIGAFPEGYQPSADDLKANGCVGVLKLSSERTKADFLPPLLTSNLVTDEIERINVIVRGDLYYLFVVTHGNKMTVDGNDLVNRDFMIGFVSSELFGPYVPLNKTGLVITQKSPGDPYVGQENNEQYVYSWLVVPAENGRFVVISYSNFSSDSKGTVQKIKSAGPVIELLISGTSTRVGRILGTFDPAGSSEPLV